MMRLKITKNTKILYQINIGKQKNLQTMMKLEPRHKNFQLLITYFKMIMKMLYKKQGKVNRVIPKILLNSFYKKQVLKILIY